MFTGRGRTPPGVSVASGSVLAGQATAELTHTNDTTGIIVFAVVTGVVAAVGYRVIHVLGRVASVVRAPAFIYLGIRLLDRVDLSALLGDAHSGLPVFRIVGLVIPAALYWLLAHRDTSHIPEETRYTLAPPR